MNRQQSNRATEQQATSNEENLRPGDDIAARLVRVGAATIRVAESLPRTRAGRHLEDQLLRSGTAAGAHHGEARAAESRADFIHKLRLGAKELREAIYWLCVIQEAGLCAKHDLRALAAEMNELVAILIASARTALRHAR